MISEHFSVKPNSITGPLLWPEEDEDEYIETWREIESLYSSFTFAGKTKVDVTVDWTPLIKSIIKTRGNSVREKHLNVEIKSYEEEESSRN